MFTRIDAAAATNLAKLPEVCAAKNLETGETILIKRGESGYYPSPHIDADTFNAESGVTARQREAMQVGSMFGWHVPGADADNASYDRLEGGGF